MKEVKDFINVPAGSDELATWNYNPVTNSFFANERLKTWFGLEAKDEFDLEMAINAIVPEDRERVKVAIQSALTIESRGEYDIEYTIVNPMTGVKRKVHAIGNVWYSDHECSKWLNGTLEDISQ
ncbi:PAS domain-containing protein [Algoriphagus winogradskyi]|uniref:PAS fold-containing protein n=1 Tax=Algoriphagus winogradskyi TaxID=237017 RepID=A0ABY1P3Q3_9BACT|nr:PAS domain-containing protein [Algoriphagus winogradskyi]SMP25236.1 PAS fold-containing protein [Algoriphagus winogradskyi]